MELKTLKEIEMSDTTWRESLDKILGGDWIAIDGIMHDKMRGGLSYDAAVYETESNLAHLAGYYDGTERETILAQIKRWKQSIGK